jgi:hypothetical protein
LDKNPFGGVIGGKPFLFRKFKTFGAIRVFVVRAVQRVKLQVEICNSVSQFELLTADG